MQGRYVCRYMTNEYKHLVNQADWRTRVECNSRWAVAHNSHVDTQYAISAVL